MNKHNCAQEYVCVYTHVCQGLNRKYSTNICTHEAGAEYKEYGNPVTGGRIVFAYTSMYKDLSSHKGIYDDTQQHTRTCRGSFLFLDIPDLMPNMTRGLPDDVSREYVLFTSPDVLFLQDINSCNLGTPSVSKGWSVPVDTVMMCFVMLGRCVDRVMLCYCGCV